ncbi:MAG TPA: DUF2127 domain-containing protein [Candidatus Polarisedimenticolia bacterium]|jgi:uncharacterized membrane protein (DUF2068 family)|nr:DUF2127 domain-containing protein [Candidatus Polarisedimenticolia bacterium]
MNTQKNLIVKHFGLRGIALFEAAKGLLAVMVAIWLLSLLHKDIQDVAEHLLHFLHRIFRLNPDGHLARSIIRGARRVTPGNLHLWIGGTILYSIIRFAEAAGLWMEKQWAEWFALISGCLYLPIEIYELAHHATPIKWAIFATNLLIVAYLAWLLRDLHNDRKRLAAAAIPKTEPAT